MTQIQKALLLAAAFIGIALLAVVGIIPEKVAQWAPMALLSIFPAVWIGQKRRCAEECGTAQ